MRLHASLLSICLLATTADTVLAAGPYAFVTGRRDPRIYAIDLGAALKPANNKVMTATVRAFGIDLPGSAVSSAASAACSTPRNSHSA